MSDTYLSRPVMALDIDWSNSPTSRIDYDLNEIPNGFGEESFWGDADHVIHGWSFVLHGDDEAGVAEVEDFFESLTGRRLGFWLPTPAAAFVIVDGIDGTSFTVTDRYGEETWDLGSELHVQFAKDGQPNQYAKVTNIVDNLDGTETVTIGSSMSPFIDDTWKANILQYVRLATDLETGKFDGEQKVTYEINVIELPQEYANIEIGKRPLFLYHFWVEDGTLGQDWYLTNFTDDVDVDGDTYSPLAITHGSIERNMEGVNRVTITARGGGSNPLASLIPVTIDQVLKVEILQASFTTLSTNRVIFAGRVIKVRTEGLKLTAECAPFHDPVGMMVPNFLFQPKCNHRLYSTWCGVNPESSSSKFTVTLGSYSADGLTVTATNAGLIAQSANYFGEGYIETGDDETLQRVPVLASTAPAATAVVLTLARKLSGNPGTGTLRAGCDGSIGTCETKFSNLVNFGGHRFASRNLALKAIDVPDLDAEKK